MVQGSIHDKFQDSAMFGVGRKGGGVWLGLGGGGGIIFLSEESCRHHLVYLKLIMQKKTTKQYILWKKSLSLT